MMKRILLLMVFAALLAVPAAQATATTVYTGTVKSSEIDYSFTSYRTGTVSVVWTLANPKSGSNYLLLVKHCPTTLANCPYDADQGSYMDMNTGGNPITVTVANGNAGLWLVQLGPYHGGGSVAYSLSITAETDA